MVALLTLGFPATLDNPRWRAMMDNDTRVTGPFIVAVTTTGLYCRPGCLVERPRRLHVRFFDTADEACAAGYRACPHCQPGRATPG